MAPIVTRCVAAAGGVLCDRAEQSEALAILERISSETGWKVGGAVVGDMKRAWGWGGDVVADAGSNGAGGMGSANQTTSDFALPLPLPSRPPSILQLFGTSSHTHSQTQPPITRTSSTTAATSYSNSPTILNLTAAPTNAGSTPSGRHQSHHQSPPGPPTQTHTQSQTYHGWYQQAPHSITPSDMRRQSMGSQHIGGGGGSSSSLGWG